MSSSAGTTPEGPGSVSGAPDLPVGFADTFTSRYVDTGEVRLHAVTGGGGRPLLLVHGWPQTWYAWRMLMPALARDFTVVAVDQRGIGLSGKPPGGYDTAALAGDLAALMGALGHARFAVYGTDVGMPIAYALAADHRDRVDRLVVSEAPLPGISPSPPLFLPPQLNERRPDPGQHRRQHHAVLAHGHRDPGRADVLGGRAKHRGGSRASAA
jgi:pimeloyl-ACP methyl ester carboxylesterase